MNGEADGFALVGESAADGLFDPPAGIGTKFNSTARFEPLDCFHQTEVTFGDEVENWQAAVFVICGKFDHEAEVGLDHQFASTIFSLADTAGDGDFLCAVEERSLTDASEIGVQGCRKLDVRVRDFHYVGARYFCSHIRLDW
jgi:hypothetical protein